MYGLPDFLPGKRAFAVQMLFFHGIASVVFLQMDPRLLAVRLPAFVDAWIPAEQVPFRGVIAATHATVAILATLWYVGPLP